MKKQLLPILAAGLLAATAAGAQTYQEVEDDTLSVAPLNMTVEQVEDADVVGASGEEIGEVDEVLMEAGEINALAVDVGGFLGIGEKTVIVPLDRFSVAAEGDDLMLDMTKEELEALPEWND
ncbi:PRC-barrel domain-containing protein [Lutibaculum baratangense]|uniref:PRC-barrel domain-containing protein n=1 Tax=Lutibaculum baratangense AMV1 TaxID=631454 RepID=V4RAV9_9HYPH|nr:PRC-barrel domain-containing protein [Lutibaculum baratangense]ESR23316.1 hypothetical protein N177_3384 [Lutibaculum baratangense AMV1]